MLQATLNLGSAWVCDPAENRTDRSHLSLLKASDFQLKYSLKEINHPLDRTKYKYKF